MSGLEGPLVLWTLPVIQVMGLISAWLARLNEGCRGQTVCRWFFLGCLGLVSLATMISPNLGPGCWLASGTTLSLMVLAATCDFSRSRQAEAW